MSKVKGPPSGSREVGSSYAEQHLAERHSLQKYSVLHVNQLDDVYNMIIITKDGCNYAVIRREKSDFTMIPVKFQVCIIPACYMVKTVDSLVQSPFAQVYSSKSSKEN